MAVIGNYPESPFSPRSSEGSKDPKYLEARIAGLEAANARVAIETVERNREIAMCRKLLDDLYKRT